MDNSFNQFINLSLNDQQREAVEPKNGILQVIAGAGSGKTRVITSRITNLIVNHNVHPSAIVALTFTNKAAKEMKERISLFLKDSANMPFVGTFHSFCLRLLKSHPSLFPNFSMMDEDDQVKLIKRLIEKHNLDKKITPKQVISYISKIKNNLCDETDTFGFDIFQELYNMYEQEKEIAHCLDFDDLILKTLNLFDKNEDFKQNFQNRVKHILVDEYQDTNKTQHQLIKYMTLDNEKKFAADSLCIVGDEDQSIYSWRGAHVQNMLDFKKDFEASNLITIDQNYRSVQPILSIANKVIKNNSLRNIKNLWSQKNGNDAARLIFCSTNYQEAEAIALFIKQSKTKLGSHAILYRSHAQSRSIEEALLRHTLPYKIIGGIQFYERLEIKDLLAYLRLIVNPHDRLAFSRILNVPARTFGPKFEEQLFNFWDQNTDLDYSQIIRSAMSSDRINQTKVEKLSQFLNILEDLTPQTLISDAIQQILRRTGYFSHLDQAYEKDEADTKKENVKELLNAAKYFEENDKPTVQHFLEEVALIKEINEKNENKESVYLMTLHAAKGLEFDITVLAGFEDGILPSSRSLPQNDMIEEERRLLYVGITRAKEKLLITSSKFRNNYGKTQEQTISRFFNELDHEYITSCDLSRSNLYDIEGYFQSWLGNSQRPLHFNFEEKIAIKQPTLKTEEEDSSSPWRNYQTVTHTSFGIGVIQKVEKRNDTVFLTIKFKTGLKKLDASFIKAA